MNIHQIIKIAKKFEEKLEQKTNCTECTECNDTHCCMNFKKTHSLNEDTNEAKCIGYKKSSCWISKTTSVLCQALRYEEKVNI